MLRAEGLRTRLCVSNIIMVAVVSEKKYICRIARFNALEERYAIIKFKQGDDFIFPQTIYYYILYVLVRVYKYILFKRSKTVEMPSATPATYWATKGKTFFGILSHFRDTLNRGKTRIGGWRWLWPGGVARSTATATATTTTSCSGFLMLTRPRKKVRERRIYFFSIHKEMKT